MKAITSEVKDLKQYFTDTKNPIAVISVEKTRNQKYLFEDLKPLFEHIKILIIVENDKNDVNNSYMLVWRVANNIDSNRDLFIDGHTMCLDATNKNAFDNFNRRWPDDVDCSKEVIESLRERKIIDVSDEFINKFYL